MNRVRPSDAAGLVLIRACTRGDPEILIGRRPAKMGFLPGIHVVPGGRVDREDTAKTPHSSPPHPVVAAHLAGRREATTYLNAALRETFEETGLLVGRPFIWPDSTPKGAIWDAYRAAGLAPDYGGMDYLCRAITPVKSRRRFNTRFFLADGGLAEGTLAGNGELEELAWVKSGHLADLTLVDVTEYVLKTALGRWRSGAAVGSRVAKLLNYRNDILTLRTMVAPAPIA
ncbi:NUDIX hydrolase [Dongia sp.]|uniref:NUDIX hydrolase n=1 Tax=Dongia sp. TaxID=1977262 RepID=UPI0035B4A304